MRGITANFEYKIVMIMLKIGCKFRTSGGYFKAKFANFAETLLFGTLSRLYLNTTLRPLMHLTAYEKAFSLFFRICRFYKNVIFPNFLIYAYHSWHF